MGNWKGTPKPKSARRNLEARSGLFALVFIAIDEGGDIANQFQVEAGFDSDLLRTFHFFNIGFQDAVQDLVRRKGVRVLLIWTELGRGRFLQSRARDQFPFAINVAGQLVDHEFGNIGDNGETASHITVESAVTDGIFRFIAGAENHGTEFIRKGHKVIAANTRLDVFLGRVDRAASKDGGERLLVRVEDGRNGNGEELDAEIAGEGLSICFAAFGGVRAGHGNAEDVFFAESSNGDGGDDGRIYTTAEADNGFDELALANIVARAEDKCLIRAGHFVGRLFVEIAFASSSVEQNEVLFKPFGLRSDFACSGEGGAGTIEDQRVVAADLIDVNDRAVVVDSCGTKHTKAKEAFFDGERRSGNVDENASALLDQFGDGVAGVHRRGPERFVVPDVFANGDAELLLVETVDVLFVARLKIAGFVEDIVGRKKHLGLFEDDAAFMDQGCFIGNGLPCFVVVGIDAAGIADDSGKRHLRGDASEGVMIALNERRAFEKIEGKIPADAEFGEDGELGAKEFGLRGKGEDARGIANEIANRGIELSEGYFHSG